MSIAGGESGPDDTRAFGDGTIGVSGLQWKWVGESTFGRLPGRCAASDTRWKDELSRRGREEALDIAERLWKSS